MILPRLIPVIDLQNGQVVRAVAGRRSEYRPLVTQLTEDPTPIRLANIFANRFAAREIYIADLDAIAGRESNHAAWLDMAACGPRLCLDAGLATAETATRILALAWPRPPLLIVGLETLRDPRQLAATIQTCGPDNTAFSLDLREGRAIHNIAAWQDLSPMVIAAQAVAAGFSRIILLDLARVGTGRGSGTGKLCRELRECFPGLELIVGGGIFGHDDFCQAADDRADAVLVASALHDGRISNVNDL